GALTHPSQWQHLTATSITVPNLRPGWTYCFTVTARDVAGNLSTRSAGCAVRPLDDRAMARATTGWSRITGDRYYLGTATTTPASGRTLMLRGMRADALSIVATRCSTCGAI